MSDFEVQVINEPSENLTGLVIDGVAYLYWLRVYKSLGITPNHARKIIPRLTEGKDYLYFSKQEFKENHPNLYYQGFVNPRASNVILLTKNGEQTVKHIINAKSPKKNRTGYLYVIFNPLTGFYKIGIANNPKKRLRQLVMSSGISSLELVLKFKADRVDELESELHRRFYKKRIVGEWFALTRSDIESITQKQRGN